MPQTVSQFSEFSTPGHCPLLPPCLLNNICTVQQLSKRYRKVSKQEGSLITFGKYRKTIGKPGETIIDDNFLHNFLHFSSKAIGCLSQGHWTHVSTQTDGIYVFNSYSFYTRYLRSIAGTSIGEVPIFGHSCLAWRAKFHGRSPKLRAWKILQFRGPPVMSRTKSSAVSAGSSLGNNQTWHLKSQHLWGKWWKSFKINLFTKQTKANYV